MSLGSDLDWRVPDSFAVFPDFSLDVDDRSRAISGMSRESALEFSFFLSIPRWCGDLL